MPASKRRVPRFETVERANCDDDARRGSSHSEDGDCEGDDAAPVCDGAAAAEPVLIAPGIPLAGDETVIMEAKSKKRITISLQTRHTVRCAVCGQTGHTAGFVGAVYVDCPVKPCYLCKQSGHTTATCPFRLDPTHNIPAASRSKASSVTRALLRREREPRAPRPSPPLRKLKWQVSSACLKLHERRVTALDFPPSSLNLVCSCDKKGVICLWDFEAVSERTTYTGVHGYQINSLVFVPGDDTGILTASCDGHACRTDIETGLHTSLCNLNPGGWVEGVTTEKTWCMMQTLAVHVDTPHCALAGDSFGKAHMLDLRSNCVSWTQLLHEQKISSMQLHPFAEHLLLTAGNDHLCKLFDVRMLRPAGVKQEARESVCEDLIRMPHPRVISSAAFSPVTGGSMMTTCGDNRIRVWDNLIRGNGEPSRELVHSHDFNRYLTPFRAVWDPKDLLERTIIIGRYISEDHGGIVLHPIDILDAGSGALVSSLVDANLQLINPVNVPHPVEDVIVTGSSGNLYCWRPEEDDIAVVEGASGDGEGGNDPRDGGSGSQDHPSGSGDRPGGGGASSKWPAHGIFPPSSQRFQVFDLSAEFKKSKKKPRKKADRA